MRKSISNSRLLNGIFTFSLALLLVLFDGTLRAGALQIVVEQDNPGPALPGNCTFSQGAEITTCSLAGLVGQGAVFASFDLVLLENGASQDVTNWSDVMRVNASPAVLTLTLFSDEFGDFAQLALNNPIFVPETAPFTTYLDALGNMYQIYSDPPPEGAETPAPATIVLVSLGLAGLGISRRKRV